jgi:hypothetical protein
VKDQQDFASKLEANKRYESAKVWALGARDVAELTQHPVALKLWEFIDNRTTIAAPMPEETIYPFFPKLPEQDFGFYAYLTPILDEDKDRLPNNDPRLQLAIQFISHMPYFDPETKAIYLPYNEFSHFGKGILLLHEAMHAWLYAKKPKNSLIKNAKWAEEVKVFKFEFELLKALLGSGYTRLCNKMTKTIKPVSDKSTNLGMSYQSQLQDEKLIQTVFRFSNSSETAFWLSVCKAQAFWNYFHEHNVSPDVELAQFLKSRQEV